MVDDWDTLQRVGGNWMRFNGKEEWWRSEYTEVNSISYYLRLVYKSVN